MNRCHPFEGGEHTAQAGDDDGRGWLQAVVRQLTTVEEGLGALKLELLRSMLFIGGFAA